MYEKELQRLLRGHSRGITINRLLLIVIALASAGACWFFQTELSILESKLRADEQDIQNLRLVVAHHTVAMKRFNQSTSDEQVLTQLHALGIELNHTETLLESRLNATEDAIDVQLNQTVGSLNKNVIAAESEIQTQVSDVKVHVNNYIQQTKSQLSVQNNFMIYQLAGTFALIACLITMWHMTTHLRKFYQPTIQRKILAILWMVPIYAITSWLSLVFESVEGYLAIIKDFYEAYIIYLFLSFCIAVLGRGDRDNVVDLLVKHVDHLSPPIRLDYFCNKNPYPTDRAFAEAVLVQCQAFAMQFVFLRPLTSIAIFVLQKLQYPAPHTGLWDYKAPQFYLTMVQNISIFFAFAGLLKFYHAVDKDLAWCRPFAKFMCIKGVVFMTFWQGLAINVLANTTKSKATRAQWAMSAQNFLICLEMLLFSIAHYYTYPPDEWREGYREEVSKPKSSFSDSLALGDFVSDLKLIVRRIYRRKKREKAKRKIETVDEEEDNEVHTIASTDTGLGSELDAELEAATNRLLNRQVYISNEVVDNGPIGGNGSRINETPFGRDRSRHFSQDPTLQEGSERRQPSSFDSEHSMSEHPKSNDLEKLGHGRGPPASEERHPSPFMEDSTTPFQDVPMLPHAADDSIDTLDSNTPEAESPPGENTGLLGGYKPSLYSHGEEPMETAGLLGGSSDYEDDAILRPSIFTFLGMNMSQSSEEKMG